MKPDILKHTAEEGNLDPLLRKLAKTMMIIDTIAKLKHARVKTRHPDCSDHQIRKLLKIENLRQATLE